MKFRDHIMLPVLGLLMAVLGFAVEASGNWNIWEDSSEVAKSPGDGVRNGRRWCLNPKAKCTQRIPKRLEKRYGMYCPEPGDPERCYWEKYAGGLIPAHLALTSVTEAPVGPAQCSPDESLRECGLMGITWYQAEKCGCNVCHPECAVACAARMGNKRRMEMMEEYPELEKAPPLDRYVLSGMGGINAAIVKVLLEKSGALRTKPDGDLVHASPYKRLLTWYASPKPKPKKVIDIIMNGAVSSYKIGFRIARPLAGMKILMKFYGVQEFEDMPRGELKEIEIPARLPPYPGNKLHGRCDKFKEMLEHRP